MIVVLAAFASGVAHGETCREGATPSTSPFCSPVELRLGIRGALNWVTFYGEDSDIPSVESTAKLRHVPAVAIVAGILSASDFFAWRGGLELDLSYVNKGSGLSVNGEERGSLDLRYYDLTLLARIEREIAGNLRGYVLFGPGVGFLGEASYVVYSSGSSDVTGDTTATDVRFVAGLGAGWAFRPSHAFTLDVRTDIGTRIIDSTINESDMKNVAVSLSLGYQWSYWP